jgi:spermidine synthase
VVQRGRERRLMMGGQIQSVYFPDGDWSPVTREYWAGALAPLCALPPRPRVLLLGLGGGTQVHLLKRDANPRLISVIERDPVIIRVALDWFGLRSVGGLEILCGDAEAAVRQLALSRRRFDFIMEDVSYLAPIEEAIRWARSLAALVAPGGVLVLNQHQRPAAQTLGEAMSDLLPLVRLQRVRRLAENVLVFAGRASEGATTAPHQPTPR